MTGLNHYFPRPKGLIRMRLHFFLSLAFSLFFSLLSSKDLVYQTGRRKRPMTLLCRDYKKYPDSGIWQTWRKSTPWPLLSYTQIVLRVARTNLIFKTVARNVFHDFGGRGREVKNSFLVVWLSVVHIRLASLYPLLPRAISYTRQKCVFWPFFPLPPFPFFISVSFTKVNNISTLLPPVSATKAKSDLNCCRGEKHIIKK